jgi:hypothetical protein
MVHALLIAASLVAATPQTIATSESSISVRVTGQGRPMTLSPGFVSSGDVRASVAEYYPAFLLKKMDPFMLKQSVMRPRP